MTKKTFAAWSTAAVFALSLTACQSGGVNDDPPAGSNAPAEEVQSESPTAEAEPSESPTPEVEVSESEPEAEPEPEAANPVFGETYTWENGLSVTVSQPEPFEPSEYAAVGDGDNHISFDVTIVNGTGENYDPAIFNTTMQSGNTEASQIFDSESGLGGSPSTTLLADREAIFTVGYTVADPDDLVLDLSPGFEYENVVFTN